MMSNANAAPNQNTYVGIKSHPYIRDCLIIL